MAVFCKGNDDFTREVKESIMARANRGIYITKDLNAVDSEGNPVSKYGPFTKKIMNMNLWSWPAWILKPIFSQPSM